tara:strand:+ start:1939 stop:2151 length:213 start_codon:yes stop_codon:yes gene_type:complete
MIKYLLIAFSLFVALFFIFKLSKKTNLKYKTLILIFLIFLISYFIFTGKINYLISFFKSILPIILRIFGI